MNSLTTLASGTAADSLCNQLHEADDNAVQSIAQTSRRPSRFLRRCCEVLGYAPCLYFRHGGILSLGRAGSLPHPSRWRRTLPPLTRWPPRRYGAASRPLLMPT